MMFHKETERTGIVEELAANRAKYASRRYVAPQDRIPREPKIGTGQPESGGTGTAEQRAAPAVLPPPRPKRLPIKVPNLRLGAPGGGTYVPVEGQEAISRKARDIIHVVSAVWGVEVEDVLGKSHARKHARPRQASMALMVRHLKLSQPSIARIFSRDSSTVTNSVTHVVPDLLVTDRGFAVRYAYATRNLRKLWSAM